MQNGKENKNPIDALLEGVAITVEGELLNYKLLKKVVKALDLMNDTQTSIAVLLLRIFQQQEEILEKLEKLEENSD